MDASLSLWAESPGLGCGDLPLRTGKLVLGRSKYCDLVVKHPTVAPRHALVAYDGSKVIVTDLSTQTGTYVNGQRVDQCELVRGQIVRFGLLEFILEASDFRADSGEKTREGTHSRLEELGLEAKGAAPDLPELALTPAQAGVYQLLLKGFSEKGIAAKFGLSQHTIHNHVQAIYRALAVNSRAELLARHIAKGNSPD
jgi:pSer/pThr/pTyr-binding forkhead associated (FHA) protein